MTRSTKSIKILVRLIKRESITSIRNERRGYHHRPYRHEKDNNKQFIINWMKRWMKWTNMFKNTTYQSRQKRKHEIRKVLLFFNWIWFFKKNLSASETTGTYNFNCEFCKPVKGKIRPIYTNFSKEEWNLPNLFYEANINLILDIPKHTHTKIFYRPVQTNILNKINGKNI